MRKLTLFALLTLVTAGCGRSVPGRASSASAQAAEQSSPVCRAAAAPDAPRWTVWAGSGGAEAGGWAIWNYSAPDRGRSLTAAPDPDGLEPNLGRRLRSGLRYELAVDVETGAGRSGVGRCSVEFDLWDEVFRVKVKTRARTTTNLAGIKSLEAVLEECTDWQSFDAAVSQAPPGAKIRRIVREE